MQAGKLRSKMDLCRLVPIQDNAGGTSKIYSSFAENVRCDIRAKSTKEKIESNVSMQEEIYTILLRYRNDVLPTDFVRIKGRIFNVEGYPVPNSNQKNRTMIITARYVGS